MKHHHVIYNSSEKNRSGGVGFGVRSASAGISPLLLSAMEHNGIFSFKDSNTSLTPSALFENPDLIKETPSSYFFQVLSLGAQGKTYILGRKISVGFDYSFYLNGRPGRLGNYVVDSYIFSSCPDREAFELLLENPAAGSRRFIPADPSPRAGNEEMRSISIGHCPELAPDDRPFKAASSPAISSQAITLLFGWLQSIKDGKPLLVESNSTIPPSLMAALASMLPADQLENITFITNYNEQGRKFGINIFFPVAGYRFNIFPAQWVKLDLRTGEKFDSAESKFFSEILTDFAAAGNIEGIRRIVRLLIGSLHIGLESYDFLSLFPDQLDNPKYKPLYIFTLESSRLESANDIREFENKLRIFIGSDQGKAWLGSADSHATLIRLYESLRKHLALRDMSDKEGKDICDLLCMTGLTDDMLEKYQLLWTVLNKHTGIPADCIRNIWSMAEEFGYREYLRILAPEYLEKNSPAAMTELLDNGYITQRYALDYAFNLGKEAKGLPYLQILTGRIEGAEAQLDFLVTRCSFSDEVAMSLLERWYPESHKRILKLRKPSLLSMISGFLNKFQKGRDETKAEQPVSPKQEKNVVYPKQDKQEKDVAYSEASKSESDTTRRRTGRQREPENPHPVRERNFSGLIQERPNSKNDIRK